MVKHLRLVTEYKDTNNMTLVNILIVFGPSLLRAYNESPLEEMRANPAMLKIIFDEVTAMSQKWSSLISILIYHSKQECSQNVFYRLLFLLLSAGGEFVAHQTHLPLLLCKRFVKLVFGWETRVEAGWIYHVVSVDHGETGLLSLSSGNLVMVELATLAVVAHSLELIGFAEFILLLPVRSLLQLLKAMRKGAFITVRARVELQPAVADLRLRSYRFVHFGGVVEYGCMRAYMNF